MDLVSYLLGKHSSGGGVGYPKLTPYTFTYENNYEIESVDLSGLDAIYMQSLGSMFSGCSSLLSITWGEFPQTTGNIYDITSMFENCYLLESIDLSQFDFSNLTNTSSAFAGCYALTFLDLRTIDFSNVVDSSNMLSDVPTTCTIVVADSTQVDYFNNNFSDYTNVITVEEYESV